MVLGSIQFDLCIASQSFTIDRNDKLRAKMFLQKVATRVVAKKIVCWLRKSFRRLTTEGAYASCIDAVDAYGGGGVVVRVPFESFILGFIPDFLGNVFIN